MIVFLLFSFFSFFYFFPFILAAICCAQLLWLGEMRLLIPKVARREESQQLCPLPACRGGGAGRVAGQVGAGGTWCLPALYTTGRKSAQHSALLILMWCERPNDRGNKWEFWYLGKVLCNLPNMPSLPSACTAPVPHGFWEYSTADLGIISPTRVST